MIGILLLSVPFVLAQVLVKGTVKDNLGEGVPGASVQVKGTSQGTITDLDGKFSLNIPPKECYSGHFLYWLYDCRSKSRLAEADGNHPERRY